MSNQSLSFWGHIGAFLVVLLGLLGLWLLPIFIAGYPHAITGALGTGIDFEHTGVITDGSRLLPHLLVWLQPLVGWNNLLGWTMVSAATFAIAVLGFWLAVYRLQGATVAWVAALIFGLMPMYWIDAVRINGYPFALAFLCLGMAAYTWLYQRQRTWAVVLFAICYGLTLASRDAFITFIPWLVLSYLWLCRGRMVSAALQVGLFLAVAYISFTVPLLPNALQPELSWGERVQVFLPTTSRRLPETGHLYPDDFTFEFDRAEYDELIVERASSQSFIEAQHDANYRDLFGVTRMNFWASLQNSMWLFINALPPLVLQETVGGIFLWLFIIPGAVALYRRQRTLLVLIGGLWLSMELLIRFVLHFGRIHLMNVGWVLALLAALGIVQIATAVRRDRVVTLVAGITLIVCLQLVQTNRFQFTKLYTRSPVPGIVVATQSVDQLPEDSVVIHGRDPYLLMLSSREHQIIHDETIDRLATAGRLAEPFIHYGATHIIGYSDERTAAIKQAVPSITVLQWDPAGFKPTLSPLLKHLLHVIR